MDASDYQGLKSEMVYKSTNWRFRGPQNLARGAQCIPVDRESLIFDQCYVVCVYTVRFFYFVVFPVVFFCFSKVFDAKKYITITGNKKEAGVK